MFGIVDYVVFVGMLAIAALVGIFYAYKDRNTASVDSYYFGSRNMSPIPVGISIGVTFISSITVLGYPTHSYLTGTIVFWFSAATLVQVAVACLYYIPLYHRLQISSVYEYLELRFHSSVRRLTSLILVVNMIFYMGLTIYLTSLALNVVTLMDFSVSILLTAGICTFYTTLGGVKAVIWTDTIQAVTMVGGSLAVFIKTSIMVGGPGEVWAAVDRGQRNTVWNFSLDPTVKMSFWSIFVGMGTTWSAAACCNQLMTQRYQSCKNVRDARIASLVSGLPMAFLLFVAALNGCAMYAYFEGCDPFKRGLIANVDQSVPYLVLQVFRDTPGMAGLFVAAAYSGMLSTVSSGINGVSGLILEDFLLHCYPKLSEKFKLTLSKILGLVNGVIVTTMAYLTSFMGKTVIQMAITVVGVFFGPILGLYTLGIFLPWTNTRGALVGLISSLVLTNWMAVGGIIYGPKPGSIHLPPLSVDMCPVTNVTSPAPTTTYIDVMSALNYTDSTTSAAGIDTLTSLANVATIKRPLIADTLYAVSYLYLGMVGMIATIIIGLAVSFLTGANDPKKMDPKLFVPFVDNSLLPESVRKFFRFGVPSMSEECHVTADGAKDLLKDASKDEGKTKLPSNESLPGGEKARLEFYLTDTDV